MMHSANYTERLELDQGATITQALIEKYSLIVVRTEGKYILYRSDITCSAFLVHGDIVVAIGATYHLEPFLNDCRELQNVLDSIDNR